MSDQYSHYAQMDDLSDGSPFSFSGTHSDHDHHALGPAGYLAIHQASYTLNLVSPELQGKVFFSKNTSRPVQFSSPFGVPIPPRATDIYPSQLGYSSSSTCSLIHEDYPQTVAMPTPAGNVRYDVSVMDAHGCHYDLPYGPVYDNCMIEDPSVIASQTYPADGTSSYVDSTLSPVPTPPQSPCHRITSYQHVSPLDSTLIPSPSANFDFSPYSSSSPPLVSQSLLTPPSNVSDQNQPYFITTLSIDQCHTITVSLDAIEFPPYHNVWELSFFECCWEDCGVWITCDHDAVRDHMARVHNIALKGKTDGAIPCKWTHCSSAPKRSGMVRHLRTHFGLMWQCSVCGKKYTRTDSLRSHADREPQCRLAQAVSRPSEIAYRVGRVGGDTVALTKVLQQ